EVYQSLEPAHRLAFGYGLIAWEFLQGARNWTMPALIAAVFKLTAALGGDSPRAYLGVLRVLFCLLGVGTAAGAWRLARALGASGRARVSGGARRLGGGLWPHRWHWLG